MAKTSENHVLEINLISAQGLIESSVKPHRTMKTYAVAWVDSSTKLRTRVDRLGGPNPTWNDKFLFKVSSDFLFSETATVSIEIYTVGIFRDRLIGSARIFVSNFLQPEAATSAASASMKKTPAFVANLIRSPSGEFFGTLNVGGMVLDGSGFQQAFRKVSGIDYRDLSGKKKKHHSGARKSKASVSDIITESVPSDFGDHESETGDNCDCDSSTSSLPLEVLKELIMEGKKNEEEDCHEPLFEEVKEVIYLETVDDSVHVENTEEMVFDNEERRVQMEKDVKITMEENTKLREMVEMLMGEVKEKSTVISDLTGRVKNLEKKLSRRNKQRKPNRGKPKFYDGVLPVKTCP
ncbi:C2 calcium-dependent membrane targeting [Corchorus olitorius]|uniref:C2 calcium-dependent membrane targeting n=1 Tax=Corchorus olitorius TaxID=93759 RepID=A0A1R3HFU5_9ROSI|nr:C2 calcium-dependent membrane targeting [Corchorus olitorius]